MLQRFVSMDSDWAAPPAVLQSTHTQATWPPAPGTSPGVWDHSVLGAAAWLLVAACVVGVTGLGWAFRHWWPRRAEPGDGPYLLMT